MIRTIKRNMSRNFMKDMGFDSINKRMRTPFDPKGMPQKIVISKMQKTRQGRDKLAKIRYENRPLWKRILEGEYRESAEKAFKKASFERFARRHPDKVRNANGHGTVRPAEA